MARYGRIRIHSARRKHVDAVLMAQVVIEWARACEQRNRRRSRPSNQHSLCNVSRTAGDVGSRP